jgi:adenylate cyclase
LRQRRARLRGTLFLGLGIVITALGVLLFVLDGLRDLELDTVDARFSIRGEQSPPSDLVVVKIDDVTFQELDQQWPFPRRTHARVIDRIAADKPKVIAYDVQFSEPSQRGFDDDIPLAQAIADTKGRTVVATVEVNERGQGAFIGDPKVLEDIDLRLGNGLFPNDPGGVLRRVSYEVGGLETLAVVATEVASGRQVDAGEFDDEGAWIDYYGPEGTIPSVSFSRVVRGKVPKGFFRDKVVVVGPSNPSLQDVHPTPTSGNDEMSGAEIQASAIDTVRRGNPIRDVPAWLDIALIVMLGMVAPVASLRFSPMRAFMLALALAVVFAVGAQLAFQSGWLVSVVYPLGTLLVAAVGALAIHYVTTAYERERVRDMFSRFVPENVVDDLIGRTDGVRLGGVQREGTVMFSDLRGFTSFAESLPVERVIDILNRYLTGMSDAILDHGGTLVAYMGDGIMAVFGAPIAQDDHADRALEAAREMLGPRLAEFNRYLREEGLSEGFRIGIGLNSGPVMSGNVGSERRLEYTAIGDTTNTAARLEGMTKGTPHQLFVADSTRSMLRRPPSDLVFVDELEVRGRLAKVRLWALADEGSSAPPADEPAGAASAQPATE